MSKSITSIKTLNKRIIECKKCPRLYSYIRYISKIKVKRFSTEKYWGKPLPSFGDIQAEILIVGLAPAAHGGNRTGRMFTGDSSGDWIAKVLFENNLATKPVSKNINDGFVLKNCYITAAVHCAPPDNKPTREEMQNCLSYLDNEIRFLQNVRIVVCLGKIAFDAVCKVLDIKKAKFSHGNIIEIQNWTVLCSYHPSRQNTQTGRLQWDQWNSIFVLANKLSKKHA